MFQTADHRLAYIEDQILNGKTIDCNNIYKYDFKRRDKIDNHKVRDMLKYVKTLSRKPIYIEFALNLYLKGLDYQSIAECLNDLGYRTRNGSLFTSNHINANVFHRFYYDMKKNRQQVFVHNIWHYDLTRVLNLANKFIISKHKEEMIKAIKLAYANKNLECIDDIVKIGLFKTRIYNLMKKY